MGLSRFSKVPNFSQIPISILVKFDCYFEFKFIRVYPISICLILNNSTFYAPKFYVITLGA